MSPSRLPKTQNAGPTPGPSSRSLPADQGCRALQENGTDCQRKLLQAGHTLCPSHHREYRKLYESYKLKEKQYISIGTGEGDSDAKEKIEARLVAGKEALALRDQVNRRFFSEGARNRGHIKWILKLRAEISDLEQLLAGWEPVESASSPAPESPEAEAPRVFRSLLSPEVPMSALSHLPPDSPVHDVKRLLNAVLAKTIEKLYSIAPSLDDSSPVVVDEVSGVAREPTTRDFVIRFLFREFLLYRADADVLARANRTRSIDTFLRESLVDELEDYTKFFGAFYEGRDDTFHLLRDAVCDYFLDPQLPSTTILGAEVATEDALRRMGTQGWDVLRQYFRNIVGWWNLELFAIQFEDLVAVKSLTACGRYGLDDPSENNESDWYDPDQDVSQECKLAVIQGFVAVTKGFCDPIGPSIKTEHGLTKEKQTRCYVAGRMSKKNPLAQKLAQELSERVVRYQVVVYDREEEASGTTWLIPPSSTDQNPWITRSRAAPTKDELSAQPWMIEWSLENIRRDLELMFYLRDRNMARDYYEFIIMDRTPGRNFNILGEVADALSKLQGDVPYEQHFHQAIRNYVPAEEHDMYFELISQIGIDQAPPPMSPQYLGNRVRCWDVADTHPGALRALLQDSSRVMTLAESRLIAQVCSDLEARGILERGTRYEPPRTKPVILHGVDGLDDLYFYYDLGARDERAFRGSVLDFDPPTGNSLVEFAQAYRRAHPRAVFAKGRIHVPYCAWPMPALARPQLNFCTPEGRLYRWKALPFDLPLAARMWQYFVNSELHGKLPFARLVQTTLVVAAEDPDGAEASLQALRDVGRKHGWTFAVPSPLAWTADVESLDVGSLWEGVRPALPSVKADTAPESPAGPCLIQ